MASSPVQVPALKLIQKGVDLYLTRLRIDDISKLYQVDRFDIEENVGGYQRSLDDARARQVKKYVQEERPGTLPAALVMNCRDPKGLLFKEIRDGVGKLSIKSNLWLVDGQHRIAGLELAAVKDQSLGDY